jgi:hypothetical protein
VVLSAVRSVVKRLQVRWWEAALAVPLLLVVVLFLVARDFVAAVVLVAVATLTFLWRAEIVERNIAGGYARVRGWVLITQWFAMAAIYVVIVGVFWVAHRDHWSHTRPGVVAVYASAGLAFFLAREMLRRGDEAFNYLVGGEAEVRIADALEPFRAMGWDVVHDVRKDKGGNVDHLVLAPNIAFAIETKSGRETAGARGQTLASAAWAKEKYRRRWVNGVLCVLTDPPPAAKKVGLAWVTGIDELPRLLQRLSGQRLPQ